MTDSDTAGDASPPATPRRPVTDELHGESIVDPYRWLEDGDDEAVREWTDAQNDYAEAVLDTPHREALAERFEDLGRVGEYGPVTPAGDRLFQAVAAPEDEQPVVYAYDDAAAVGTDDGTVLADPNDRDDDGTVSVDWFVPGPEGEYLAYGVAEGGDEQYDVRVVEVATGAVVETVADAGRTQAAGFAWVAGDAGGDAPDPRGFYYVTTGAAGGGDGDDAADKRGDETADGDSDDDPADGQLDKAIRFHEFGSGSAPARDHVVADDIGETTWPTLVAEGDALVAGYTEGWDRTDLYGYRGDPATATLSPVLTGRDAVFEPTVDGDRDRLLLATDHGADFSRVLSVDLADALGDGPGDADGSGDGGDGVDASADAVDVGDLTEVIPEGEAVLRGVEPAGDRLLAHYHRDASSELVVFDADGTRERSVELPAFPTVAGVHGASDAPEAFATVQSFAEPPSVRRVDLADGATETQCAQSTEPEFEIEVSQERFESADGTEVPAFVVRREGVDADGDNPALLTGYGGFRVNRTPTFDRFRLPFLAAGGVFVLATLRGGTEYGEPWHEAGRRGNKQRVFDDALAVADGLAETGWADPDRIGVTGGSNGGLLVGALITRRPERFRVALCHVPLLDMLRFHRFLLGASWTSEYGHPDDPEAFAYLREYSPYHNAPEADYPATMFTTALGDTRVHPSHARKMTALVQDLQAGDEPVILRVEDDAGHGVGKPTSMRVRENSERWGFVFERLGIDARTIPQ
ncbi:prolyl oligopeptidase family serine peptidase [Halobaculum sp. CBA1158]|uniref:prolyl oligopeptidase family serine peptidase n=1 Tax=Halobaculum sp. CBA1158 TaxID=2904243 RepID=UPI001F1B6B5A|nr:prolyl oligopeptidase family serine peptidase [Halobaculum sp. CBA1158]UIP00969.1 prolyl oligopeptidase family serine peptidase [Halobaculum sp. CBA1158]